MGFIKSRTNTLKLVKGAKLLRQTYDKVQLPKDVVVLKLNVFPDDHGGWFKESLRLDEDGNVLALKEQGIYLKVRQTNMSYIGAGTKRFWHIHPKRDRIAGQNEIWTSNGTILVGLIDLRRSSKTWGIKSKVVLSPDKAVFIPSGVAHGLINPNNYPVTLTYFTDSHFDTSEKTKEYIIDAEGLPYDFVEPEIV